MAATVPCVVSSQIAHLHLSASHLKFPAVNVEKQESLT